VKAKTVAQYIAAEPKEIRARLREVRDTIAAAAPGAKQSLKWGMPAFSYDRILVTFAAFRNHIGFFPTPAAIRAFEKDLAKFKTSSATIQLPHDKPLPKALIARITKFRVKELREADAKWRTGMRTRRAK
jgi:uncharacterized protein YdhG (YjbR/CyaY superfamily)